MPGHGGADQARRAGDDRDAHADHGRRLVLVADDLRGGLGAAVGAHRSWFEDRGWDVEVLDAAVPGSARRLGAMARAATRVRAARSAGIVHCHGLRSAAVAIAAGLRPFVTVHGAGRVRSDPRGNHGARRVGLAVVPRRARAAYTAAPELATGRWRFVPHASPRLGGLEVLPFPDGGAPVFAWIGRLDEPKRPLDFVRAVADLGVRGLVAGDGPLRRDVEDEVRRRRADVEVLGWVDDVRPVISAAWAAVLWSDYEAVPFALQEAMWCGRPVVATPLAGVRWLCGGPTPGLAELTDRDEARCAGDAAARRVRTRLAPGDPWPTIEAAYARA